MSFAASDPGHVCPTCGGAISWLDHLPPLYADEPVRCYARLAPPALRFAPAPAAIRSAIRAEADARGVTELDRAVAASPAMRALRIVQDEAWELK